MLFTQSQTLVVCETWVAGLQEENYENARQFVPERWLDGAKNKNPFLTVPFGVGRRRCPGKRVAEQEMMVVTAKVMIKTNTQFCANFNDFLGGFVVAAKF